MKLKYYLFFILTLIFLGNFLIAEEASAACSDRNKCCKCYSGTIGDDVVSFSTNYLAEADTSSAETCNVACLRAWPEATYYTYGTELAFKEINKGSVSQSTTAETNFNNNYSSYRVPGATEGRSVISCGRAGQRMCTLCDIIVGINNIIRYGFQIAIVVALTAISIGGVMYTISAGNSGQITQAKGIIKNAAIGMIIIFAAWLIVNYTMILIGAKSNLGITRVQGWSKFECNPR